jgi:hypothetical protein
MKLSEIESVARSFFIDLEVDGDTPKPFTSLSSENEK